MRIKHTEPLGVFENIQDPLPTNWREISKNAGKFPKNFGVIEKGKLYRSGVIWPKQVKNLFSSYGIENVITFLDGDWLEDFYESEKITIHQFPIYQRKELTFERVEKIVKIIDSFEKPAIISCLKGAVRTGIVAAGYEYLKMDRSSFGVIFRSMKYKNFNYSALKEILRYPNQHL